MVNHTRCRWFRFSLRFALVLITLLGCYLGWATNWIRERQEAIHWISITHHYPIDYDIRPYDLGPGNSIMQPKDCPWCLRLLGERGVALFIVPYDDTETRAQNAERVYRYRHLFPEAGVATDWMTREETVANPCGKIARFFYFGLDRPDSR